jgi:threonine dehydratase
MHPSPLLKHPLLDEALDLDVWVKHENHNPTGAFKIRGGLNLVGQLSPEDRKRGVITASTGNHGQSMAYACRALGVRCRIAVPLGNNPDKNAAMCAYGAEVVEKGRDFDEAREWVEATAARERVRYIHSANEPHLIAGVATYALEIFDELPDVGTIIAPIGGGSGAAGCGLVRTALGSQAELIGVQATRADAFTRSWRGSSRVTTDTCDTFAEGMATRMTYDLTFDILKRELNDVVTLEEEELEEGVRLALTLTHNLAEGAGGASIAAASKLRDRLKGKKVVCVMSGGNITTETLARILGLAQGAGLTAQGLGPGA